MVLRVLKDFPQVLCIVGQRLINNAIVSEMDDQTFHSFQSSLVSNSITNNSLTFHIFPEDIPRNISKLSSLAIPTSYIMPSSNSQVNLTMVEVRPGEFRLMPKFPTPTPSTPEYGNIPIKLDQSNSNNNGGSRR
ncbi:hypothetical protein BELL_0120g00160 [Botrytis elliptica]|uniref:Uncharacterized protein n=1 Tax=Botrytis elliptica TaxID=278938 RepID=A0A4Z1K7A8_9HELO|nr:hypothetical protein BELL_0120g00160 [Botrytis elliptica]